MALESGLTSNLDMQFDFTGTAPNTEIKNKNFPDKTQKNITPQYTAGLSSSMQGFANTKLDRSIALLHDKGEYERLKNQHLIFAKKKVTEGLSVSEEKKYKMVLWSMDSIEDAQVGDSLDILEQIAFQHESLEKQLRGLVTAWTDAARGRKRSTP